MIYQVITQYKNDKPEIKARRDSYKNALKEAWEQLLLAVDAMAVELSGEEVANAYKKIESELFCNGYIEFYDYTIAVVSAEEIEPISMTISKALSCEFCEWPEEIWVTVDIVFLSRIAKCEAMLEKNPEFKSITIDPTASFLSQESDEELNEICRVGTRKIEVYRFGAYYTIYSKYDSNYTAEYEIL